MVTFRGRRQRFWGRRQSFHACPVVVFHDFYAETHDFFEIWPWIPCPYFQKKFLFFHGLAICCFHHKKKNEEHLRKDVQHTYVCKMPCGSSPLALHPADAAQVATAIATRSKDGYEG